MMNEHDVKEIRMFIALSREEWERNHLVFLVLAKEAEFTAYRRSVF